ncbi:hypothetical protein [Agromyces sp. Marseille-P2726]|uniref:hypothetical protein n=1 Tax=Agromyces sp. Marseille-P2726 TaxID=2709132 RepID=UPI00156D9919|nr:hypothetical protein [Agromyces sp. Marseille-P2726]
MGASTEGHVANVADQLTDRAAAGLLLAFLTAVIVVLGVGTFPMSASGPDRADESVATSHSF